MKACTHEGSESDGYDAHQYHLVELATRLQVIAVPSASTMQQPRWNSMSCYNIMLHYQTRKKIIP